MMTEQQIAEAETLARRAHPPNMGKEVLALSADLRAAVKALEEIACLNEPRGWDEPASVAIARQALAGRGEVGR